MQIFSPDGKYSYVCSSFNPETDVIAVATDKVGARVKPTSPFVYEYRGDAWTTTSTLDSRAQGQAGKTKTIQRQAALQRIEGARHRPDHQPRQHRAQRERHASPM